MSVTFDAHAHCFPPLGLDRGEAQYYDMWAAEHQYHVRFHPQGVRRSTDSSLISLQKQNAILTTDSVTVKDENDEDLILTLGSRIKVGNFILYTIGEELIYP